MKQRYIKLNNKVISTSSIYNAIENPIYDYYIDAEKENRDT